MSGYGASSGGGAGRKVVSALLIAALTIGAMSACREATPKAVRSPVEIKCLVANPIHEAPVSEDGPNSSYRSFTITGLKNRGVERRVNGHLQRLFSTVKDSGLPPYRGIKARIPDGSTLSGKNVNMHVMGSFNNMLSVAVSGYISYAPPPGQVSGTKPAPGENQPECHYALMACVNLDLNTGNPITLREVFADDIPYLELVNASVRTRLNASHAAEEGWFFDMELGNLKLVKPFEGVAADQCFFVTEQGLMLVFDYRTPEFETNLYPAVLRIPWGELEGKVALMERYYDEAVQLYTDEAPPEKRLLYAFDRPDRMDRTSETVGRVRVDVRITSSTAYPPSVRDVIEVLGESDEQEVERLSAAMDALPQSVIDRYGEAYYNLNVNAYSAGRYVSVMREEYSYIPSPGYDQTRRRTELRCFDRKTGNELLFKDLFVDGYDPAGVVMSLIRTTVDSIINEGDGKTLSPEAKADLMSDANIRRLYEGIRGVALSAGEMSISLPPMDTRDPGQPLLVWIPYSAIGSANLVIFR